MSKHPEKYEKTSKFYFNGLDDAVIKVEELLKNIQYDDIRLQIRPHSKGHVFSVYATIKKGKTENIQKEVNQGLLLKIVDVEDKLLNEIKDIKTRLKNMGYS